MKVELKKARSKDLIEFARIHKAAYGKDHFSARFSELMLARYYQSFLNHNDFCYSALDTENQIVGFIIAGNCTGKAMQEFIAQHKWALMVYTLISPKEWSPKIKGFFQMFFHTKKQNQKSKAQLRLLSIAVTAGAQGKGIGAAMIAGFDAKLRAEGQKMYGLSVRNTNPRAVKFYRDTGFKEEMNQGLTTYFLKELDG